MSGNERNDGADDVCLRDPKVVALAHLPGSGGVRDRKFELIAAEIDERWAPAGAVLVEDGSCGGELFFVIEGKAAVLISGQEVALSFRATSSAR